MKFGTNYKVKFVTGSHRQHGPAGACDDFSMTLLGITPSLQNRQFFQSFTQVVWLRVWCCIVTVGTGHRRRHVSALKCTRLR